MRNQESRKTFTGPATTNRQPERTPKGAPTPEVLIPDPDKPIAEQELVVLLAMCLFGEARGESDLARRAVAQLLLNRARNPRRVFGSKPEADFTENLRRVILQPWQFSCFNPDDANRAKLLHPLDHEEPAVWERCLRCARQALQAGDYNAQPHADQRDELTANSDHYFDDSIQPPSWAHPSKQTVKIGRLNFYRLYLSPPAAAANAELPAVTLPGTPPSGSRPTTGLPAPHPQDTRNIRPGSPQRHERTGRLAAFVSRLLAPFRSSRRSGQRGKLLLRRLLRRLIERQGATLRGETQSVKLPAAARERAKPGRSCQAVKRVAIAAMSLTLLLAACADLERTAYQTMAVTKAEYETLQRHVAEAAVHGLITTQQWNRFQAEGHRFIDAHNSAADAFALWRTTKADGDAARLEAMLQILPRLILEIRRLVGSFQEQPEPEVNGQESASESAPVLPPAKTPARSFIKQSLVQQSLVKERLVKQLWL
ncbi:MAG: cell wall hydrolase [Acidobacteria bacterium]|nr:cell wall hydrolase [Acidobacteriota bacterium]